MTHTYYDTERENDAMALPNLEVFHHPNDYDLGAEMESGWYYWTCLPGCMPDSDPYGPYDTEEEATDAAREDAEESTIEQG